MKELQMNTYMYAPKDSSKHRNNWRDLYLEYELGKIRNYYFFLIYLFYCTCEMNKFDKLAINNINYALKRLTQPFLISPTLVHPRSSEPIKREHFLKWHLKGLKEWISRLWF